MPDSLFTKRSDGSPISPIDLPKKDKKLDENIEFPGEHPFTRGIRPTMYRGQLWTMRQYAGFGTAEETNRRFHHLLDKGQTGLSTAFDLPTQMGFDADHSMSVGEVGRVGVSISTLEDMEKLFDGIPLNRVSTSMTINSTAAILLCLYMAVARKQGVPLQNIRGTTQNDILKEYIARGTFIFPPKPSLRIVTDLIAYAAKELPGWNPISISGYHIREAGSDAAQEIAFTLSNACAYAKAAVTRGLDFDQFAGQLSFFLASHNDFIEESAKFRAARRLWAKLAKERFGAKKSSSMLFRFHAQTAGSTLTAQQPNNNLVRVTLQALAAILGGCQSLHTNSRDEALALPTEESATLALRTQQILAEEMGIASTIDPLGGSYTIEKETERLCQAAEKMLGEVDQLGGSVAAIEKGYFQRSIAERAYKYQQEIERRERRIVGVNAYGVKEKKLSAPILRVDPALEEKQRERVKSFKKKRDPSKVNRALQELRSVAEGKENVVPAILAAVESQATLGEISNLFRALFGEYQPREPLA